MSYAYQNTGMSGGYTGAGGGGFAGAGAGAGGFAGKGGGAYLGGGHYGGGRVGAQRLNGGGGGDCGGDCGAGDACGTGNGCGVGCSPGCGPSYDTNGVLTYVGAGGDYMQQTSYKYVGQGAGDFEMVAVPTNFRPNICVCIIPLLLLLLLIPLLLYLLPLSSTEEPIVTLPEIAREVGGCSGITLPCCANGMTPLMNGAPGAPGAAQPVAPAQCAPCGPPKDCTVYGDPHVNTFDGKHADYYTPGEYWIMKSDFVKIQGKYAPTPMTNGLAVTKGIAISGAIVNDHKLIIGTMDQGPNAFTWDGQPILTGFPSAYTDPEQCVQIQYNSMGSTMQKSRVDKQLHVLHITLKGGMTVQVNEWNEAGEGSYINVKITMPQGLAPGVDGHCGNFNGNPADDARLMVRARVGQQGVDAGDLMFPGGKTPINPTNRPDINDCDQAKLEAAKDQCKKSEKRWNPSMGCLIDVCFAGAGFAQEDVH